MFCGVPIEVNEITFVISPGMAMAYGNGCGLVKTVKILTVRS